ncbi:hypothetical protein BaRGS_00007478 [Batillaria attramentaria]|uniref:Uncharacterized protein n=1 Tax=Batillaria attramentaria TaxID=370345 RepID=A0ABD0LPE7_9CAEN
MYTDLFATSVKENPQNMPKTRTLRLPCVQHRTADNVFNDDLTGSRTQSESRTGSAGVTLKRPAHVVKLYYPPTRHTPNTVTLA